MTHDEKNSLRADILAHLQSTKPAPEPLPLPPQADRARLTPDQQQVLHDNWLAHIDAKPTNTWSIEECAAMRYATVRALQHPNR